jgi:hypothetical protein
MSNTVEVRNRRGNQKKRDVNEQIEYENLLSEYVSKIRNNELTVYRAAKLSSE